MAANYGFRTTILGLAAFNNMYIMRSSLICFRFFLLLSRFFVSLGIATGVEPSGSSGLSESLTSKAATLIVYKVKSIGSCSQFLSIFLRSFILFLFFFLCIASNRLTTHSASQPSTLLLEPRPSTRGFADSWLSHLLAGIFTCCFTYRLACLISNNQAFTLSCSKDYSLFLEPTGLLFQ